MPKRKVLCVSISRVFWFGSKRVEDDILTQHASFFISFLKVRSGITELVGEGRSGFVWGA
jgi:hypothetical protein